MAQMRGANEGPDTWQRLRLNEVELDAADEGFMESRLTRVDTES